MWQLCIASGAASGQWHCAVTAEMILVCVCSSSAVGYKPMHALCAALLQAM